MCLLVDLHEQRLLVFCPVLTDGLAPSSSTVTVIDLPNGIAKVLYVPEGEPVLPKATPADPVIASNLSQQARHGTESDSLRVNLQGPSSSLVTTSNLSP